MQPHPHTVFVNRPPRRRSRMPQLLFGSTSLGAMSVSYTHLTLPTKA